MRVLVTGITGFVGAHLAEYLVEDQRVAEVWGLVRWNSRLDDLEGLAQVLRLEIGDLGDGASLIRVLRTVQPDVVIHLAAASTVASSWATPAEIMQVNAVGQINLLEAIRTLDLDPVIVVACSGEAYGLPDRCPVTEIDHLRPVSPYGVSKAAQDLSAHQYHVAYGLQTIRLRLFNHTGPRRPDRFVASSFARQIAEIEKGLRPPRLNVGNLDAVRDFTDVRDVVRAYGLVVERGVAGTAYNVCSGTGVSIRTLLDKLLELSEVNVEVRVDPGRLRPAEIPMLYGSHAKLGATTGWRPEIGLEQTLHDLLSWWRSRV